MENMTLFDLLPEEEAAKYKPQKATDWKWTFADYPKEKNGIKVFSCFACGGGSTMGYKLAGCDVIGCCEIDPKMNEIYVKNHHPKHNYLMDIRDFNEIPDEELPAELFDLDVLDGSPPCTTFSMCGDREKNWGKKKKFREGQKEQTLDDLSFVFIETAKKLKPRAVIMENVEGLARGVAFQYIQNIYGAFEKAGYKAKHWLFKGENMGIPQNRHRVIFIAFRNDMDADVTKLDMNFNYSPILYREIKSEKGREITSPVLREMAHKAQKGDRDLSYTSKRERGKDSLFNFMIQYDDEVCCTIPAKQVVIRFDRREWLGVEDAISAQTFPQDYDFGTKAQNIIFYFLGMSVPPVMMKRIIMRMIDEGVFRYKGVT